MQGGGLPLSQSRTGMLSSPGFEEETRKYLQKRLRLMTGSVFSLIGALSLAFVLSMAIQPEVGLWTALAQFCTRFPNSLLAAMTLACGVLHFILRRRRLTPTGLSLIDGLFMQVLIAPCLILYALLHHFAFSGFAYVVPFLVLFILTRAILAPSTAVRTTLLSLPAPIGVAAIQMHYGAAFSAPGRDLGPAYFIDTLIQNQVILLGAVTVAAVASKVNLGLRRRTYDAKRVGQYELQGKIGEGAMGEVYLATHSLLKRPTALKFLRPEITGERTLRRFEREVRQNSRLSHPNTISIYDYGRTAEGVFYYAMEMLDGANLRQIVDNAGPMPASRTIHVLAQACAALNEAHMKGIVHRDIKPANLMLCEQGGQKDVLKVLDFGLARELDERGLVAPGAHIAGTPETMAPEVISASDTGPASDLYSLCVTGCYLLTGAPLFEASSVQDVLRCHQSAAPIPPSRRNSSVPADLEAVLLQGLRKRPQERFPSAGEMRQRLLQCSDAGDWDDQQAAQWWVDFEALRSKRARTDATDEISATSMQTLDPDAG